MNNPIPNSLVYGTYLERGHVHAGSTKMQHPIHAGPTNTQGLVIIDLGVDIDNAPRNMLELKRVVYPNCIENADLDFEKNTDLYSIAFPYDQIQEYCDKLYEEIEEKYKSQISVLDSIPLKNCDSLSCSAEPKEKITRKKGFFHGAIEMEVMFAFTFLAVYSIMLIAGIFLALPVGIENFTHYVHDLTAITAIVFFATSIFQFIATYLLFKFGLIKEKEK